MKNSRTTSERKLRVYDVAYISLSAAFIAVCSWISIPSAVPFTLQTFSIFLILGLFGGKRGTLAVVVYLLLGAVGLPVFSSFRGGIGAMLGATGGYLTGFALMAVIYWLAEPLTLRRPALRAAAMAVGLLVCYAFGTAWFMKVYAAGSGSPGLGTVISMCVAPFIIPDIIKLALAALISDRLKAAIKVK